MCIPNLHILCLRSYCKLKMQTHSRPACYPSTCSDTRRLPIVSYLMYDRCAFAWHAWQRQLKWKLGRSRIRTRVLTGRSEAWGSAPPLGRKPPCVERARGETWGQAAKILTSNGRERVKPCLVCGGPLELKRPWRFWRGARASTASRRTCS